MSYKHIERGPGGAVLSKEWNEMGHELERLETDKFDKIGGQISGDLKITGTFESKINKTLAKFDTQGSLIFGADQNGKRFTLNPYAYQNSTCLQITFDNDEGDWNLDKGLTIERSGNIGIGTKTPAATLDVNGDIQAQTLSLTKDLEVKGNLTVQGDVIAKDTQHIEGNVQLGNEDNDAITVYGELISGHSSGSIYIKDSLKITEDLNLQGSIKVGGQIACSLGTIRDKDGGWIRTYGQTGWLSQEYGGGWYMEDSEWIKSYGDKSIYHNKGVLRTDGDLHVGKDGSRFIVQGDRVGIGKETPETSLDVNGCIKAKSVEVTENFSVQGDFTIKGSSISSEMRHRMYPSDPLVYQDIFEAKEKGVIEKLGSPGYDETTYNDKNPWNYRTLIRYSSVKVRESDGNGAKVIVPEGYDTLWVRTPAQKWTTIKAYFLDQYQDLGLWTGGYRYSNCYCPDGSLSDSCYNAHQWIPIPVGRPGEVALIYKNTDDSFWISGIGFSKNPWNHATQSAVGYHWALNGTESGVGWGTHEWKGDIVAYIPQQTNIELKVPVIASGKDKLLYIIEHNNDWNGAMHESITVNGSQIERFIATYDNPFARHWNSKFYQRYIAARIPASLISTDERFISVKIDMRKQNHNIYFREMGTHDMEL